MGETQDQPFQFSFNPSPKIDFRGSRVTSDGGLILVRELDERLGLGELIELHLADSRRGKNSQFAPHKLESSQYCHSARWKRSEALQTPAKKELSMLRRTIR